jgi:hypothetical protein
MIQDAVRVALQKCRQQAHVFGQTMNGFVTSSTRRTSAVSDLRFMLT